MENRLADVLALDGELRQCISDLLRPDIIDEMVRQHGGLAKAVLEFEGRYARFTDDLHRSALHCAASDEAVLRYVRIVMDGFSRHYAVLQGVAAQAREKQPVDRSLFHDVFREIHPQYEAAPVVIERVFCCNTCDGH